ncbi:MAG: DUF4349 domain-containing protein [Bacteroidota bacterium]
MKITTLLIILAAGACGGGNSSSDTASPAMDKMAGVELDESEALTRQSSQVNLQEQEYQKKVIKTGNVNYRAENAQEEYDRVVQILPSFNAYISSEDQNESYDRINYNLTVKVPPQNFDSLFATLIKGRKIDSKYVNIDDVTAQYYDLRSRIENKKKLEARYQDILKKATKIKDILEIEQNLNQVRTEIESLEGQLKLLSYRINFSTIDIRFYEILPYTVDEEPRPGFGARFVNSISWGWQGFLTFLIFIVGLWPFAILAIGVVLIVKQVTRKKDGQQ